MEDEVAEPDLTPMLDVVFILLIFFIVTATFVKETGIDVPGSDPTPRTRESEQAIVVEITRHDRYYVDQKHADRRALEHHIARLHAERPDDKLVISASAEASTQALVHALDMARLVGIPVAIAAPRS